MPEADAVCAAAQASPKAPSTHSNSPNHTGHSESRHEQSLLADVVHLGSGSSIPAPCTVNRDHATAAPIADCGMQPMDFDVTVDALGTSKPVPSCDCINDCIMGSATSLLTLATPLCYDYSLANPAHHLLCCLCQGQVASPWQQPHPVSQLALTT